MVKILLFDVISVTYYMKIEGIVQPKILIGTICCFVVHADSDKYYKVKNVFVHSVKVNGVQLESKSFKLQNGHKGTVGLI